MAGKGKKGKKKQQEIPLVHPEPVELDEAESGMLWDQVASIRPNPLSTIGGAEYNYSTTKVFQSGPPHPIVALMASPTVPLLAQPPPSHRAATARANAESSPTLNHGNSFASALSGVLPSPSGALELGTAAPGGYGTSFAPRPPPRSVAPQQRASNRLLMTEKEMRTSTHTVAEELETHRGFWLMITHELFASYEEIKELLNDVTILEHTREHERLLNDAALDEQQHQFDTEKFALEYKMDQLMQWDPQVQETLDEKRATLRERKERDEEHFQLQRAHMNKLKQLAKELQGERDRLEELMNQRLAKTTDEMAKLTTAQREQRQKRAQEESNRLVAELTVLEHRSKHLNDRSMKLQTQADSNRRDRELEQHRRTLLIEKNHKLTEEVKVIVAELQELEQDVGEKQLSAATGQKMYQEQAMDRVDQQYESIAFLRTELEKVRSDTESTRAKVKQLQRELLAEAGGKYLPISLPMLRSNGDSSGNSPRKFDSSNRPLLRIEGSSSQQHSKALLTRSAQVQEAFQQLDANTIAAIRSVVLESVKETNELMARNPVHGCSDVFQLKDPTEKVMIQQYVAKRVTKLLSCIYPTAPPFSYLRTAAQNPSTLAASV